MIYPSTLKFFDHIVCQHTKFFLSFLAIKFKNQAILCRSYYSFISLNVLFRFRAKLKKINSLIWFEISRVKCAFRNFSRQPSWTALLLQRCKTISKTWCVRRRLENVHEGENYRRRSTRSTGYQCILRVV